MESKSRYREFLRMSRQFRHLKMVKRVGKGNADGPLVLEAGSCAVTCPACPQPGGNLPDGWEKVSLQKRFLYQLFLAIDANFRLKRKLVSNDDADPSLNDGCAYFVKCILFMAFLSGYDKKVDQNASTCSNHSAVNNDRSTRGLAASGVGAVDCARHEMKRPMSVGDFQKGERYVNMDYLFFSSIRNTLLLLALVVSYDIACQWSINLFTRLGMYPAWMKASKLPEKKTTFLVPKFHLPAHIQSCWSRYSYNYASGVGTTDGEAIERLWAGLNHYASSTKEMGPGSRQDILDDAFGDWNWRKITSFIPESVKHAALHREFTEACPAETITEWEERIQIYERSPSSEPNPYESGKVLLFDTVRKTIAQEETDELAGGSGVSVDEEVSASQLITMGIEIEEQQRRLSNSQRNQPKHASENERANLKLQINSLRRKVDGWVDIQHRYVPSLRILRQRLEDHETGGKLDCPTKSSLHLPSSLLTLKTRHPDIILPTAQSCDIRLYVLEWRLRCAQAQDALVSLRDAIRLRAHLYQDKKRHQRGQAANTRSNGLIERATERIRATAERYQSAQSAIWLLGTHLKRTSFQTQYPILLPTDIRNISEDEDEADEPALAPWKNKAKKGTTVESTRSETRRTVSWIWRHSGVVGDGVSGGGEGEETGSAGGIGSTAPAQLQQDLNEAVRIEWFKSRARSQRWAEEVELLEEEMRRVLATFEHRAAGWDEKAESSHSSDPALTEGRVAYAKGQAAQFRAMGQRCKELWALVPQYVASGGRTPLSEKERLVWEKREREGIAEVEGNDEEDPEHSDESDDDSDDDGDGDAGDSDDDDDDIDGLT
ncbi:hypothetical protein D9611_014283 [Ephemerocybe angulata]|uniref:CxC2-like cysteine cluster KDZ transposase-associated domain-containing protein n=1 Tax=Ephemerocybe angulata TaxID=980116 RepID=A0A8H5BTT6_9AGAR|nr:hypothetical protein D9611_014283 [Tulosesus angulatus]